MKHHFPSPIIKALQEINNHHPEAAVEPLLVALAELESYEIQPMLSISQVLKLIPVTKLTIREAVKAGVFPKPVRITKRLLFWNSFRYSCRLQWNLQ